MPLGAETGVSGGRQGHLEARYRAIFDTAVDAIVVIDEVGIIGAMNPAAERLFGYASDEAIGRNVNMLMAEPYRSAHDGYLARYRATGERRIIGIGRAVTGQRRDGSTFPLELSVAEWAAEGERFFTGIMRDVTERTRAERLQRLMVNELNHRVKNTLATVQAVATHTLRNAASTDEARLQLNERLQALAEAHDTLTRENWEGASLSDIVEAAVRAHGAAARVQAGGPQVRLRPKLAVSLALALHELVTNAAKYGALSVEGGRVDIAWRGGGGEPLVLEWREGGGPPVSPPRRRGFGSRMIDSLARDMAGEARLDFRPEGLTCTILAGAPAEREQTLEVGP